MGVLPDEEALMLMVCRDSWIGGEKKVERRRPRGEDGLMMDVEAQSGSKAETLTSRFRFATEHAFPAIDASSRPIPFQATLNPVAKRFSSPEKGEDNPHQAQFSLPNELRHDGKL